MAPPAVVQVVGMQAIRKDIARATTDVSGPLFKAISAAGKAAVEPVAARARSAIPTNPRSTGRLHGSIRTSGTRTGGSVRMGSKLVPWAGWVDFGGTRPDGSSREFVKGGRYLFPAAQSLANVAAASYTEAIQEVLDRGVIWTNTGTDPGSIHD